jgi:hypothetical protein
MMRAKCLIRASFRENLNRVWEKQELLRDSMVKNGSMYRVWIHVYPVNFTG